MKEQNETIDVLVEVWIAGELGRPVLHLYQSRPTERLRLAQTRHANQRRPIYTNPRRSVPLRYHVPLFGPKRCQGHRCVHQNAVLAVVWAGIVA
jgi:hypothetical protein